VSPKLTFKLLALGIIFCCFIANANTNAISGADKEFFAKLQRAVLMEDIDWLSKVISYPIILRTAKGKINIGSEAELKQNAVVFFIPPLKSAVRNQSGDSLFKNWQGVRVANGLMWFSEVEEKGRWVYRITAINLPKAE
jgi:hypothetical protein